MCSEKQAKKKYTRSVKYRVPNIQANNKSNNHSDLNEQKEINAYKKSKGTTNRNIKYKQLGNITFWLVNTYEFELQYHF